MEEAFVALKESPKSPPLLEFPDFDHPLVVETDASSFEVGSFLAQKKADRKVHPV